MSRGYGYKLSTLFLLWRTIHKPGVVKHTYDLYNIKSFNLACPVWSYKSHLYINRARIIIKCFIIISSSKIMSKFYCGYWCNLWFFKKGESQPLFVYFRPFPQNTIQILIDGVHGTQTWGGRMEGADESNELWLPPIVLHDFEWVKFSTFSSLSLVYQSSSVKLKYLNIVPLYLLKVIALMEPLKIQIRVQKFRILYLIFSFT